MCSECKKNCLVCNKKMSCEQYKVREDSIITNKSVYEMKISNPALYIESKWC